MHIKTIFLIFLLLQPVAFAKSFAWSNYIDINLSVRGSLNLVSDGRNAESLTANLTMFPMDSEILSESYFPSDYEKGENSIFYRWTELQLGERTFGYQMFIRNYNQFVPVREKYSFPVDYSGPYIEPTENVEINDETKQIASSIASGKDDLYEVVFDIGKWVNENMEYDLSYGQTVEKTSTILKTKKGVCDEYSNLYMSLLRSLGIPSRYVGGIAYSNIDERFSSHGWIEVLFGDKWIPFDATYKQFGRVDTTHVKLQVSKDVGECAVKYWLVGRGVDLELGELVSEASEISAVGEIKKDLEIDLDLVQRKVGFGSYALVEAEVRNLGDYYRPTVVYLSRAPEVIGENTHPILLKPKETKKIYWVVKIPGDLDPKFLYTYRIQASTQENWTSSDDLEVAIANTVYSLDQVKVEEGSPKKYKHELSFWCEAQNTFKPLPAKITCHLKNTGNVVLTDLDICIDDLCQTESLFINEEKDIVFEYRDYQVGDNRVTLTASNNRLSRSSEVLFTVSEPTIIDRIIYVINLLL